MNNHKNPFSKIIIILCSIISFSSYATLENNSNVTLQDILTAQPDYISDTMSNAGQLTINGSDGTIRFLQVFFYSNTSCSAANLLGAASTVDNVSGLTFTASQTIKINSSSIYQLAFNKGITTSQIKCMKVSIGGGNESSMGTNCSTFNDITCSGTSCISNTTAVNSWLSNPTPCNSRYLYVPNTNNNNVSKCFISSSTGSLSTCSASSISGLLAPTGIGIGNYYAYIASLNNNEIIKCTINPSAGTISDCVSTANINTPRSITLNSAYAYITSSNNNSVSKCTVNTLNGALSSCAVTGNGFNGPRGMAINKGYAYIANNGNNTVSKCAVSSLNGELSGCSAASGFTSAYAVSLNNGYAYISNITSNTITKCSIDNSNGNLSSCSTTGANFTAPAGNAIAKGYVYVSNNTSPGSITYCAVNGTDGTFTTCSATGNVGVAPNINFVY